MGGSLWNKLGQQRCEPWTELQTFRLFAQQLIGICNSLQGISQVRNPQEPQRMFEVGIVVDVESGPT